jgi:hypothetical protein
MKNRQTTIRQLTENNEGMAGVLEDEFYAALTLNLNRFRGSLHEKMAWAVVIKNAVEMLELSEPVLKLDRKTFACFEVEPKIRRCDLYLEQADIAYEVKSYRPSLTSFVREQIRKDEWLLQTKSVSQIWWLLFQGATPHVLNELTRAGIVYINVPVDCEDFTNISLIYRSLT